MRRTKEDAQKTRDTILNAAAQIFSDQGVAKSTICEIAKKAGVTRGAFYWHFKNKAEIYDALHERLHRPLMARLMDGMDIQHASPINHLCDICIRLLLDLEEDKQKRQALSIFIIHEDYSGELAPFKTKHRVKKQESLDLFQQYFDMAKKQGTLHKDADTALLTLAVHCYMKGILIQYFNNIDSFNIREEAPKLMHLFFKNLENNIL